MTASRLFMPHDAPLIFWISVVACFVFWLLAYILIIKRGFQEKTYGMPLAALCCNFAWEVLFSSVFPPIYYSIQIGNTAWVLFDVLILVQILKYSRNEPYPPLPGKFCNVAVLVGIGMAIAFGYWFVPAYGDTQGYFLGDLAALVTSILFIGMLLRRDSVRGQSLYIALSMLIGNIFAYLWVTYMPNQNTLSPSLNLVIILEVWTFNVIYVVLIYRRLKREGINPWRRF